MDHNIIIISYGCIGVVGPISALRFCISVGNWSYTRMGLLLRKRDKRSRYPAQMLWKEGRQCKDWTRGGRDKVED